ncbi:hypothetical protein BB561_005177 [Smittium simulii]|uniref:BCNT-C domain-containing protein n=1 Tax=Smittium simulii TaxID=133385 RepID=A0A2T9YBM5_9FUNG|nr:hypothetical protein BB561_005177 [Smittium simulii]
MSLQHLYTEEFSDNDSSDASFKLEACLLKGMRWITLVAKNVVDYEQSYSTDSELDAQSDQEQAETSKNAAVVDKQERKRKAEELWLDMKSSAIQKISQTDYTTSKEPENVGDAKATSSCTVNNDHKDSIRRGKHIIKTPHKIADIDPSSTLLPEDSIVSTTNKSSQDLPTLLTIAKAVPGIPESGSEKKRLPQRKPSKFSQIEANVQTFLGKAPNTVELSKAQWDKYTTKEDIANELEFRTKDGYIQKRQFLVRSEQNQLDYLAKMKKSG